MQVLFLRFTGQHDVRRCSFSFPFSLPLNVQWFCKALLHYLPLKMGMPTFQKLLGRRRQQDKERICCHRHCQLTFANVMNWELQELRSVILGKMILPTNKHVNLLCWMLWCTIQNMYTIYLSKRLISHINFLLFHVCNTICDLNYAGRRILSSFQPVPLGLWPLLLERAGKMLPNDPSDERRANVITVKL